MQDMRLYKMFLFNQNGWRKTHLKFSKLHIFCMRIQIHFWEWIHITGININDTEWKYKKWLKSKVTNTWKYKVLLRFKMTSDRTSNFIGNWKDYKTEYFFLFKVLVLLNAFFTFSKTQSYTELLHQEPIDQNYEVYIL